MRKFTFQPACAFGQFDLNLCYRSEETLGPWLSKECTAKTLIRLHEDADLS